MVCWCETKVATTIAAKNSVARRPISGSLRAVKPDALWRSAMPARMGSVVTTSTLPIRRSTGSSVSWITPAPPSAETPAPNTPSPSQASTSLTSSGKVASAARLLITVKVSDSAALPRATWVRKPELAPPGQAARIISPMPSAGGRSNTKTTASAASGTSTSCPHSPISNARGAWNTWRKSSARSARPTENMMNASAAGRRTSMLMKQT